MQPRRRVRVPLQADRRRRRCGRTTRTNPPSDVADDDDRPGQDGAVHRPPGDRRDRPRRVPDRGALRPGASRGRRGRRRTASTTSSSSSTARAATPRYEQADAPDVLNETALGARLRDDVARARQRRPQLQHRHAGRVADHDQGARRSSSTASCATRSAAAARAARSSSSRSPTPTPASTRASRRRAASPTPGRRRCSTSTTSCCAATSRTRRSGRPGVAWDAGRRSPRSRATRTRPTRSRSPTVDPVQRRPEPQLPGRARRSRSTTRRRTPTGVRCTLQDYMVNVFGRRPAGRVRRPARSATSASSTAARRSLAGTITPAAVRRRQREDRRRCDIDYDPTAAAHRRRPPGARARLPQRRGQPGRQPRPGRDHRPPRPRPRRVPRRLPHLRDARAARCASTARRPTRCCGAARSPLFGDADFVDEAIVAMDEWLAAVEKDTRDVPLAQQDPRGQAGDARRTAAPTARATSSPPAACDATVQSYSDPQIEARHAARPTTRCKCDAQAAAPRRTTAGVSSPTRSGPQLQQSVPERRLRLHQARRGPRARRRAGRPTRTTTARSICGGRWAACRGRAARPAAAPRGAA